MTTEEDFRARYRAALHRVQTGVAFLMARDPGETDPKHLRVGVNSAMVSEAGLAGLLIERGLITRLDYHKAIAEAMEREADAYEQRLSDEFGVKVRTG